MSHQEQNRSDFRTTVLCFVAVAGVMAWMVLTTEPGPVTAKARAAMRELLTSKEPGPVRAKIAEVGK